MTHEEAWRIPTEDGTDYGVLVRCGPTNHPYWWLLCPATATLYLKKDSGFDLRDCRDGEECNFIDDVHLAAHRFVWRFEGGAEGLSIPTEDIGPSGPSPDPLD